MDIQLFRIDDRLIHGQVVIGWASYLKSQNILLCDDSVAENDWEKELYLSVVPEGLQPFIFSVDQLAGFLNDENQSLDKTIILVNSPLTVERLVEKNIQLREINVGGIHFREGRKKCLPYLYLSDPEITSFRRCMEKGLVFYCQDVPNARAVPLQKVLFDT